MKRVLLDQGLAPRAAALLRHDGWDPFMFRNAGWSMQTGAAVSVDECSICVRKLPLRK